MAKSTTRRANGEGSIYETSDGRLRGAVAWTDARGIRHRKVVSGRNRTEVKARIAALRTDLDQGIMPTPAGTLGEFLDVWLAASRQRIRAATLRQYESTVRVYLRPALGRLALRDLTPTNVETMTAGLIESGRSPRTAALARAVLRRALADALRDNLVHRNAAALARPPYVPGRSLEAGRDYLDTVQLRRLLTAAKVHPLGPLVTLAATTGLRQGELLGLAWTDITDGALTVRRSLARVAGGGWALAEPKTKRSRRTIDLPAASLAALERQRELQDTARAAAGSAWQDRDDLVFSDSLGRPLRGWDVNHAFHRLLVAAGLPSVPFHGLRHSAATAMLEAGVPLKTVSDQLGHSTIVVTADRYAGVTPATRRVAADAIDRALGSEA
jgi:integrase